jgi:hypothetical protein
MNFLGLNGELATHSIFRHGEHRSVAELAEAAEDITKPRKSQPGPESSNLTSSDIFRITEKDMKRSG